MATTLLKGNKAVVIGALYAGSDCYFGYPITPASEVLHEASSLYPKLGRKFLQAESEEASINMCYGAAAAGHRVFTASSGPGISLMQEGISYMAGAELPAVIVDIMRAGPGLGNIGPEQGDYNQVVKGGGHGNYKPIVLAPNSVQEMCDFTMLAFELAFKWRTPTYVLADGVLGQMIEPFTFPEKAITPSSTIRRPSPERRRRVKISSPPSSSTSTSSASSTTTSRRSMRRSPRRNPASKCRTATTRMSSSSPTAFPPVSRRPPWTSPARKA